MKKFSIKVPISAKLRNQVIEEILVDTGFAVRSEWFGNGHNDYKYDIECNSDTEFAELFIEVGRSIRNRSTVQC